MRHRDILRLTLPYTASLALLVLSGAFHIVVHVASALPAPLQPQALHANASTQQTRVHLQQPQRPDNDVSAAAASLVGGNVGTWRTAKLSVARCDLVATSLPSQGLAMFAGGQNNGALLWKRI